MCQTKAILINTIIKCIVKSIVYLSFRNDTGISFMIPIRYDTFDMVHSSLYGHKLLHVRTITYPLIHTPSRLTVQLKS